MIARFNKNTDIFNISATKDNISLNISNSFESKIKVANKVAIDMTYMIYLILYHYNIH